MTMTQLPYKSGIYCFINKINGKRYVGSSASCIQKRRERHRSDLNVGKHKNKYFQSAWNKYGAGNFKFVILQICSPKNCIKNEQKWIDHYNSADRKCGYNICAIAESSLGVVRSPETRAKVSAARKGKKLSEEHKRKISEGGKGKNLGKRHTDESKRKISLAKTGKKGHRPSDEEIEKLRQRSYGNQWNKGRKHTKEARDKMTKTLLETYKRRREATRWIEES